MIQKILDPPTDPTRWVSPYTIYDHYCRGHCIESMGTPYEVETTPTKGPEATEGTPVRAKIWASLVTSPDDGDSIPGVPRSSTMFTCSRRVDLIHILTPEEEVISGWSTPEGTQKNSTPKFSKYKIWRGFKKKFFPVYTS